MTPTTSATAVALERLFKQGQFIAPCKLVVEVDLISELGFVSLHLLVVEGINKTSRNQNGINNLLVIHLYIMFMSYLSIGMIIICEVLNPF